MEFRRLYRFYREQKGEGMVGALIGALVAGIMTVVMFTVVNSITSQAANDLPVTTVTTTNTVGQATTTTVPVSSAATGLMGILPIVFAAVMILGIVAKIGSSSGGSSDEKEEKKTEKSYDTTNVPAVKTNSAHTISVVEKASAVLLQYQNDLDHILGINTMIDDHKYFGLDLTGNTLAINDTDYDWYITAKQPDENVFKVVGLNKTDASNNVVYVLGKHIRVDIDVTHVDKAFLIKVPTNRVADEIKMPKKMALES